MYRRKSTREALPRCSASVVPVRSKFPPESILSRSPSLCHSREYRSTTNSTCCVQRATYNTEIPVGTRYTLGSRMILVVKGQSERVADLINTGIHYSKISALAAGAWYPRSGQRRNYAGTNGGIASEVNGD